MDPNGRSRALAHDVRTPTPLIMKICKWRARGTNVLPSEAAVACDPVPWGFTTRQGESHGFRHISRPGIKMMWEYVITNEMKWKKESLKSESLNVPGTKHTTQHRPMSWDWSSQHELQPERFTWLWLVCFRCSDHIKPGLVEYIWDINGILHDTQATGQSHLMGELTKASFGKG